MSIDACAKMVAQADPDRFASAMCASMPERGDLMVLYAFNVEVSRAPWMTQEEMIAEMRLQWWKDAIAEIYDGNAVRKHEVVTPLAELILANKDCFPRALFDELIEARRFDIYRDGHADVDAFCDYIQATSGNVMELAGRALGADDIKPFKNAGWAMGLANLLAALPDLYAHGRDPIPASAINKNELIEGNVGPVVKRSILALIETGLERLSTLKRCNQHRKTRPALLAAWNTLRILKRIQAKPEAVLITDFEPSKWRRSSTLMWQSSKPGRFTG